jgi:uncharacterized protein
MRPGGSSGKPQRNPGIPSPTCPARAAGKGTLEDHAAFEWDLDISPVLSQLRIPVLVVYGETDRWIPIEPSIRAWRTALDHGQTGLCIERLPGCGHFPTLAADPADLDEADPVSPAYEQLLSGWLRTVLPPP